MPGNLALLPAAVRRLGAATGWPDLMVAAGMTDLARPGATPVIAPARRGFGEGWPEFADEWPFRRPGLPPRRRILFVFTVQNESGIEGQSP